MNISNLQTIILIVGLIYISAYDIWKHVIKNRMLLCLALARIVVVFTSIQSEKAADVLILIFGSIILGILGFGLKSIINIGGGDVKLIMICELYLGFSKTISMLVISLGLLGLFAIGLLITRKGTIYSTLPVAPFITIAIIFVELFQVVLF